MCPARKESVQMRPDVKKTLFPSEPQESSSPKSIEARAKVHRANPSQTHKYYGPVTYLYELCSMSIYVYGKPQGN